MSTSGPQFCHLVFTGQLMPGTSPEQAMANLAEFFGVDDPSLGEKDAPEVIRVAREQGVVEIEDCQCHCRIRPANVW